MKITETLKRYMHDQWINYKRFLTVVMAQKELLSGAELYFFESVSTNPANVYQDEELCVLHPNPVQATYEGLFPNIYLDEKIVYNVSLRMWGGANIENHGNLRKIETHVST